ncbi:MAG: (d)CMP kinase [Gammaproteobacteria bacterium]|nr:MAG: (d)CMP kinase [Gammaproteobacteria bacterium]UCH39535.1 MAG: (d)CMP kinase [Gammaproteobacteria bacterium]
MPNKDPFVVAIDGPSGSGKGSLAFNVARELGFHMLDSGAIYRLLALKALQLGVDLDDEAGLVDLLDVFDIRFEAGDELAVPYLDGVDVSSELRQEATGDAASRVARHAKVRQGLLGLQRSFFRPPGLVADGRDMGTVVFPRARFKFFLYASPEIRAQRRYKQLINMGLSANIAQLQADIAERDERDQGRSASPLKPAEDALVVETSMLDLAQVTELVLSHIRGK